MKIINTLLKQYALLVLLCLAGTTMSMAQVNGNASHDTKDHQKQIIGYFTQWDAWKDSKHGVPAKGAYNQLNIDYSQYTILNFSFFGVAKDGTIHSGDLRNKSIYETGQTQEPGEILHPDLYSSWDYYLLYGEIDKLHTLTEEAIAAGFSVNGTRWQNSITGLEGDLPIPMKKAGGAPGLFQLAKDNNVKVMASIGGWSMCKHFPEMARDPELRANFVADCEKLIAMGFDGIDIDWEYPGNVGMNIENFGADDYPNFTLMMQEIRDAIGPDKLITAAFAAQPAKIKDFEWSKLNNIMDYYNMMTYDFHGGWSNIAGHNSPLYDYEGEEYGPGSWDHTFTYMRDELNIPPSKITMGLGFYGRGVITDGEAALNKATVKVNKTVQPDGPVSTAGDFTNFGDFDATPFYQFLLTKSSNWTEHWDDQAKVPYRTNGNYFLSYDNEQSIGEKAKYVTDHQIGGVIVWQVFGDLDLGAVQTTYDNLPYCPNTKSPLVNVVNKVFAETDGTPSVSFNSPADGDLITQSTAFAPVSLSAAATDANGSISSVVFEINELQLNGTLTEGAYTASWTPSAFGEQTITVTATDNDGEKASATIKVNIECAGTDCPNELPTISIDSPADGAIIDQSALTAISISITADDADGSISETSIEVDGQSFSTSTAAWTPSAFGTYAIVATATDDQGGTASQTINVTINEVAESCGDPWEAKVYPKDSEVSYQGLQYRAAWEASAASVPGNADAWKFVAACPGTTLDCADYDSWNATTTYQTNGMKVSFEGSVYLFLKWYSLGETPGQSPSAWQLIAPCGDENTDQPPVITFTNPTADTLIEQATFEAIDISFSATDDLGISATSLTIDGTTTEGTSVSFTPTAYQDYVVTASAEDNAGQTTTKSLTITISDPNVNQAPTVQINQPADQATIVQETLSAIDVSITASDADNNLASTLIEVDNQSWSTTTAQWTPSAYGTFTITATATDAEGLTASSEHTVTVEAPAVGGDCDGLEAYAEYPSIYNTGDQVAHEGKIYEALTSNLYNVTPGTADHWWKFIKDCDGTSGGGTPGAPVITFASPVDNQLFNNLDPVNIEFSATDDGTIDSQQITVDGQTFNSNTATFSPAAYGSYTITASATDNDGNTTTEEISIRFRDASTSAANRVLVGYWHNWQNSSAPYIRLRDINDTYNVVCIAFAEPKVRDTDNTMVFDPIDINNAGYVPTEASRQEFKEDVAYLQAQGKKVLISLGGANGVVHLDNETEKGKFVSSLTELINDYGFDGIDIDLEGSSITLDAGDVDFKNPQTPRIVNFIDGIEQVLANFPANFILTSAPETAYVQGGKNAYGGSWGGYLPILYAFRDQLEYVHVQLYNTGSVIANDGNIYSQASADFIVAMTEMMLQGFDTKSTAGFFPAFREDQVAIGLPCVAAAAPAGGYTTPAEVHKALDYLTQGISFGGNYVLQQPSGYPDLRGWMTWSINWDNSNGYEYANSFADYYGLPQARSMVASAPSVKFFPNPVKHLLNIGTLDGQLQQLRIFNSQGVEVLNTPLVSNTASISVAHLPQGIYVVQLRTSHGLVQKQILKQ
ncbi:glycosyl hydrolase family 18 protein [Persicobacter psychrovividus]|uniref:chitinase n=1 Tax=Persicobacter psychrovividus TaxID=387638 RepID=A0ABN6LBF7_9BACT|nr:hypothetical protein PEPS_10040 [Persicobacter psychrovividus]